ncbi:MAG: hypothetical protein ABS81_02835 [Pseudonocardia sp. SCN 72-86]|nr:MAG: hypothetical protein ABS81_02835 [Pseudonocardia sp. SCN 72-86]
MNVLAAATGLALPPHLQLPVRTYAAIARDAQDRGYTRVWVTEAGSADAFALLTACANTTSTVGLATGVLPIATRSPALTAQAAATVQDLSDGRFALGLGVSTPVVVTNWSGLLWDGRLARLREYVETVVDLLAGRTVDRAQGYYPMRGSRLLMEVPSVPPPVLLAALGPRMLALAGGLADGALLNYAGAAAVSSLVRQVQAAIPAPGRSVMVSAFVRACVIDDGVEAARSAAQREVMAKVVVPAYRRGFEAQGWGDACEAALALWEAGDRRAAAASLPDAMTESIVLFGSAKDIRDRFAEFRATDLDEPVVYAVSTVRSADAALDQFTATMRALAPASD